ncbi:MAG: helicase-associated domain-containing protein [Spirochaetales bacterium]|jgi:hypothetical protein|nr:helicase-associated domain-containing protein [Spirochaetales bacterium]
MKSKTPRPEDSKAAGRWKSAFLTLPDAAFFDILRNYLDIKTPYNKHSLLENLRQFLLRDETRRRILGLVDPTDAQILTAVAVLAAPQPGDLYHLFEGDMSYLDLHHHLLNLQDRLLIYIDKSSGADQIFLNPFLEDDLRALVIDPALLLSAETVPAAKKPAPWLTDSFLIAFFSCLLEDGDILKTGGGLKKKAETSFREKFPVLFEEDAPRLTLLIRALQTLKLVRRADSLEPDMQAWKEFAAFEPHVRLYMIACAALLDDFLAAWKEAQWLASFLTYLEKDKAYPAKALIRLRRLLSSAEDDTGADALWLDSLCAFGIFFPRGGAFMAAFPRQPQTAEGPAVIVQPNFDISARPHLPPGEGLVLAAAARLQSYDVYSRYELSRASFCRALALGLDGKTIIAVLQNLCGGDLPQNVVFNMNAWEREYENIFFLEGILITAAEERRHLLDHHKGFKRLLKLNPAPGVYVIARSGFTACLRIFRDAGIEVLPRLRSAEELASQEPRSAPGHAVPWTGGIIFPRAFHPAALRFSFIRPSSPESEKPRLKAPPPPPDIKQELLDKLAEAKLPEDLAVEIRERIKRKLIIFPEQIRQELVRGEKTEAKGLNYVGKTLVIEQTMESHSDYLETVVRKPDGSPSRLLIRPKALRRSGMDLILEGLSLPRQEHVAIPVKKISLVRRIRGALSG